MFEKLQPSFLFCCFIVFGVRECEWGWVRVEDEWVSEEEEWKGDSGERGVLSTHINTHKHTWTHTHTFIFKMKGNINIYVK